MCLVERIVDHFATASCKYILNVEDWKLKITRLFVSVLQFFLSIDMMNVYQQPEKSDDSIIDLLL